MPLYEKMKLRNVIFYNKLGQSVKIMYRISTTYQNKAAVY